MLCTFNMRVHVGLLRELNINMCIVSRRHQVVYPGENVLKIFKDLQRYS